ncbi:hypothetical protein ElyMa_003182900, partial [Elysia marginata]
MLCVFSQVSLPVTRAGSAPTVSTSVTALEVMTVVKSMVHAAPAVTLTGLDLPVNM